LSLLTESLIVSGVAMDLVGAGVLAHAHNAESIAEIRENMGQEGLALGERDAMATDAQLLAEKRIGFLILSVGLLLYLVGLVIKSAEGVLSMGLLAGGVLAVGIVASAVFTRIVGRQILNTARKAEKKRDGEELPEQ
jgi:hypothetical protein